MVRYEGETIQCLTKRMTVMFLLGFTDRDTTFLQQSLDAYFYFVSVSTAVNKRNSAKKAVFSGIHTMVVLWIGHSIIYITIRS